jgi:drug/metabolite transporter (DMT)-like permease
MDLSRPSPIFLAFVLAVGVLGLGMSAIFVRWANAPGIVTSFYRMAIAALLMVLPFARGAFSEGRLSPAGILWALLGGLFFALDLGLWASGVMLSGATTPTLLANMAPIWVGLGAMLFFREQLGFTFWGGLMLALAGAVIVLGVDLNRGVSLGLGSSLGLIASLFYGGYYLIMQRARAHLDSITSFWIVTFCGTLALLLANVILGQRLTGYPPSTYFNFLGAGVVTQVIGYMAITYVLGHLPASFIAPVMLGQPVMTAVLAYPLLGEPLSPLQMVGGVGVLAGIYLVRQGRERNHSGR